MDIAPAAPEVKSSEAQAEPPQSSKLLSPQPEVGKTGNGKKLFFRIPEGEGQERMEALCDSVDEVRAHIHNCVMYGQITPAKHKVLCDEIARYSSLPRDNPGAYWYQFDGPAKGLLCPMLYPGAQPTKPAAVENAN